LIQTIGRAARHINGTAILYADRLTEAMQQAIDETNRRRAKQKAFNVAGNIVPKGVTKRIKDIIDGVYDAQNAQRELRAAQSEAAYQLLDEAELAREIRKVEKEMLEHARNLEFEQAAAARDRLRELKERAFGVTRRELPQPSAAAVAASRKPRRRSAAKR
jgi:excinuclease ABC subunit B